MQSNSEVSLNRKISSRSILPRDPHCWDGLTGLPDRQLITHKLQARLDSTDPCSRPVSVLLFNIDGFKAVNREAGGPIGDRWLCAIARRLQARCNRHSFVGRLGGDEFVLINHDPCLSKKDVPQLAAELASSLAKPVAVAGKVLQRQVSVSSSCSHGRLVSAEQLLKEAQRRMRRLRKSYKDLPEPELYIGSEYQALERATSAGRQIEVFYQPEVNLESGRVVAVEALALWRHPHKGLQPASRFQQFAERSGLVAPLNCLVMHRAMHQAMIWQQRYPTLRISVKLASAQLLVPGFAREVLESLVFHQLSASALCLLVNERHLLKCKPDAVLELQNLRAQGVKISVNAMDLAHSSIGKLRHLAVDFLKIDRRLVRGCEVDNCQRGRLETLMRLADVFEFQVLADGIETQSELATLRALGVVQGQGGVLCQALCSSEVEPHLSQQHRILSVDAGAFQGADVLGTTDIA